MLAVLYLVALTVAGIAAVQRFMPGAPALVRIAGGFLAGIIASAWITYAVAFALSYATDESLTIGILAALAVHGVVIGAWGRSLRLDQFRMTWFEVAFLGLALVFSFWLMDQRLLVVRDQPDDPLVVSAETWGDTALHVALSRSFSEGTNYPTEYPFFVNEPIKYHFGYDFFAGALQEGGLSVLLSFNLPGALGFAAMMVLLLSIGRLLFGPVVDSARRLPPWWRDRGAWAGLIAVALLLTNQSMAFRRFVDDHGDFWEALKPDNWWHHAGYLTIGPYDPNEKIAIFNTLNVFLTQTHLIVAMAAVFFVAFGLLQPLRRGEDLPRGRMAMLGVLFGLSFWLNGVLYISAGVFFGALLVVFALAGAYRHAQTVAAEARLSGFAGELWRWTKMCAWFIAPALALAVPQAIWLNGGFDNNRSIELHFGYLSCSASAAECHGVDGYGNRELDWLNLTDWRTFIEYYWLNMGLMLPLLAIAAVIGRRFDRKVLFAVMAIFVWGNLVQLSRDLGGHNHKVINLWEILAGLFVAYAVVQLAAFGYGKVLGWGRLRAKLRLLPSAPTVEHAGRALAVLGAALVVLGYFLPWLELAGASASAYDLTFDGFMDAAGGMPLQDRPALVLLPLLAFFVAAQTISSTLAPAPESAWVRGGAGLLILVLGAAFGAILNVELDGAQVQPGVYLTIAGGAVIALSAATRPGLRLNVDMDPFRPLVVAGCGVALFFLVVSGLLDFMTIKNDFKVRVFGDPPTPEAIDWIAGNTPGDSVFLTVWGELYTVPTLAGRGVYLGYDPWAASAGYDVGPRQQTITAIYGAGDRQTACNLLMEADLDYVMIGPAERTNGRVQLNEALFTSGFALAYEVGEGDRRYSFYDVDASCGGQAVWEGPDSRFVVR